MNAQQEKLIKALNAWVDAKNSEFPEVKDKPLADVHVKTVDGLVNLYFDGAGYDYLSYAADYGGIFRGEVEAIAKKSGFYFEDASTWGMTFYQD